MGYTRLQNNIYMKTIKTTTIIRIDGDKVIDTSVSSEEVFFDNPISIEPKNRNKRIFEKLYEFNPALNKKEMADLLGVSRQRIYDYIDQINSK